ncbi:MAG: LPS-assembly protein LptD [bacterium ADurb.Bin363]|nr:MAG: LPS-assembly protein LptD [bacterium ADurb.Bin363]
MKKFFFLLFFTSLFVFNNLMMASAVIGEQGELIGDNIDVKISAENFSGQVTSDEFHIWGNVRLEKEDATLQADDVKFNSKTNIAVATGNVYFTQIGTALSGNSVTVEYKKKKGIWKGNVKLVQSKAPEKGDEKVEKTFKGGPVTIIADSLEFTWMEPNKVIAKGKVAAHQKDKHIYGDMATYISYPQNITLQGSVRLTRDDGSSMECAKLVMDLDTHKFQAMRSSRSQIKVNFYYDKKKKNI